jgi:hypothetical protein
MAPADRAAGIARHGLATKRWKLVVTDMGGKSAAPAEVTTEGDNWMKALASGRAHLGEQGVVPPGASCMPGSDGGVTVLDPATRRRYQLTPLPGAASTEAPAEPPSAASEPSPGPRKRRPQRTMAYVPSPVAPEAPSPPKKKKLASKTVAYMPSPVAPAAPSPPKPKEVVVGEPPPPKPTEGVAEQPAPPPPALDPAAPGGGPPVITDQAKAGPVSSELLHSRDEDPTEDTPLCYRERTVVVPEGTSRSQAEVVARARFTELQKELAGQPDAKFFIVAVFDHRWEGQPQRPPLVTLQWKDWRGDPEVQFPKASPAATPGPPSDPSPPQAIAAGDDARLGHAFDACQDLSFLSSPLEVFRFVIRLLCDLVPSEAGAGLRREADSGGLQVVAATGTGADTVQGTRIPGDEGLLADLATSPLRVDDVASDGRFRTDVEGRPDLPVRSALYAPMVHQGRVVGVLQLLNRSGVDGFTEADGEVAAYVAGAAAEVIGPSVSGP